MMTLFEDGIGFVLALFLAYIISGAITELFLFWRRRRGKNTKR